MHNIEDICKKDKQWRGYALQLCKCKHKADDLVQEMYLKLMQIDKPLTDWYVIATIRSIYFNEIKKNYYKNTKFILDFIDVAFEDIEDTIEDDDRILLNKLDDMAWFKKELLAENYDLSYREIAKRYNLHYLYVYRVLKQLRIELLE